MSIMDRLSRLIGIATNIAKEPRKRPLLELAENQIISDGNTELLVDLAASPRPHSGDHNGDSPLHPTARMGNRAIYDVFIRAGADPRARNHERQTTADVAFAEGHSVAALVSFVENTDNKATVEVAVDALGMEAKTEEARENPSSFVEIEAPEYIEDPADIDDHLTFEPEKDPEDFVNRSAGDTASGTFVALTAVSQSDSLEVGMNWEIDLASAQIAGDGFMSEVAVTPSQDSEHDFLKVRNRGPRSSRRVTTQSGTRLSVDPEICQTWAAEILEKGWFSSDDIEALISLVEGNGDLDELRLGLERTLEAAGLDALEQANDDSNVYWEFMSDVSADDLADAIVATFTRATRLPGTRRFYMDKSDEARLLEPMVRAKQELLMGVLACKPAVEGILNLIDALLDASADPSFVTMRTIIPSQPEHTETAEFFNAAETLRSWNSGGSVMDGRRRREALGALEALDLSIVFQKELVKSLTGQDMDLDSARLDGLISILEAALDRVVLEHLSYARRFAARNVEDGEDPEDVFQVAFTGLQRSIRRFDPKRGHRFVVYCTFWMKQALTRWRADEGATIRIPVHRHEKLAALDRAVERLDLRPQSAVADSELAEELGWPTEEVQRLRRLPRQSRHPQNVEEWEAVFPEQEPLDPLDQTETERIVADALAELQERQADVIRMRFGIGSNDEMTLEEIGQIYNVTRERIRQIEAKGLAQLSRPDRRRRLQTLLGI